MINYGSQTTKHNQPLVGIPKKVRVEQGGWWLKFLLAATSVAAIGLAWIPGVSEAGVLADVALNEAISATQYGIATAVNGRQSITNTILSFGTPIAGGAMRGAANIRSLGAAAKEAEKIKFQLPNERTGFALFNKGSRYGTQDKLLGAVREDMLSKSFGSKLMLPIPGYSPTDLDALTLSEKLMSINRSIAHYSSILQGKSGAIFENAADLDEILEKLRKSINIPQSVIKLLKQSKNLQEFQSILLGYFRTLNSAQLQDIMSSLSMETTEAIQAVEENELKTFAIQFNNYLEEHFLPSIGKTEIRSLTKESHGEALQFIKSKPYITRRTAINSIKMALNPANLARGITNKIYRSIRKAIWKGIKYEDKDVKAEMSLFKRNGGVELVSEWIMGYRVIDSVMDKKLIEISFKTAETYNKHPVYVWASDSELEMFIAAPGETYIDVWAYSRGGKRLFDSWAYLKLSPQSASLLAHSLNVGQMRMWLGLISNVSKIPTNYHNYWKKLGKAAMNNTIARSMRLVTKDYVGSKFINKQFKVEFSKHVRLNIPKELERITTAFGSNTAKAAIDGRAMGGTFFANQGRNVLFSASKLYNKKGIRYRDPNGVYRRSLSAKRYGRQFRRVGGIGKNFAKW